MAKRTGEQDQILTDLAMAEAELEELRKENGIQREEKGIKKLITQFFDNAEENERRFVKKKVYVLLAIFLGAFGAHRFYTKQYASALLYLVLCWSGFSLAMTIVDLMVVIPKKADENGIINLAVQRKMENGASA